MTVTPYPRRLGPQGPLGILRMVLDGLPIQEAQRATFQVYGLDGKQAVADT